MFKRMLSALMLLTLAGACTLASAQENNHYKAAYRLLNNMNMETMFNDMITQTIDIEIAQNPSIQPFRGVMLEFMAKHMSFESILDELVLIYTEAFTEQELKQLADFYETPVGQKSIRLSPTLFQQGAEVGTSRVQKNMHELEHKIKLEAERLEQKGE